MAARKSKKKPDIRSVTVRKQAKLKNQQRLLAKTGDVFIDVGKLAIGGVVFSGIMTGNFRLPWLLTIGGFGAIVCIIFGIWCSVKFDDGDKKEA
jgi:uncharacterized membrane protein YraQ (UPF0718 family)